MDMALHVGPVHLDGKRFRFQVWAPLAKRVELHILGPQDRLVEMVPEINGYYQVVEEVAPGSLYLFRLDGQKELPDPASRYQPQGVHGPSEVTTGDFDWTDGAWSGMPISDYVLYEIHVGTYSPEGTFAGVARHLTELKDLGITAIELMPVAQFPGVRGWGYDVVYPFAVQASYGGPVELKRLVDSCHNLGISVVLDVVYNHLGQEGNYLADFGQYFSDYYKNPWGRALNFDGTCGDEVRRYFIENALYWLSQFHVDALRLDALHAIIDSSAQPFIEELAAKVEEVAPSLGRRAFLIGESDRNDARLVRPRNLGGFGLNAVWNDDFHHALHVALTGEQAGYYQDFNGLDHLCQAWNHGFVYRGQRSQYRKRRQGHSTTGLCNSAMVVFSQNHDQVGNRMLGDRLAGLVSFEYLKLAAALVLWSPYVPLLFMGEEYGEKAPFLFFVDYSEASNVSATREGRRREFASFGWKVEPPDPQDEATFLQSKLDHDLKDRGRHAALLLFYREAIHLRRDVVRPMAAVDGLPCAEATAYESEQVLFVARTSPGDAIFIAANFAAERVALPLPVAKGRWFKQLDTEDAKWGGPGGVAPGQLDVESGLALALRARNLVLFSKGP